MIFRDRLPQSPVARLGQLLAIAVVVGMGLAFLVWAVTGWTLADANAYWQAGLRLRVGADLYPAVGNLESSSVFRYAPWFAWVVVPVTYLPLTVVAVGWSAVLIGASTIAVWPLVREQRYAQLVFFWPILIAISASGNVHAVLVATLVHGVERRSGPLWIAIAASLKAVPLLFALVYLGRRQWLRAAATVLVSALLVAPALIYDLSHYPSGAGGAGLLIRWLPIYVGVVLAGITASLLLARTTFGWLAAATTAALTLPRFFTYDVTFLLVGTARRERKANGPR